MKDIPNYGRKMTVEKRAQLLEMLAISNSTNVIKVDFRKGK